MMASTTAANIQRVVKYIHQFIDASSDHFPYLRDAITLSYKRSQCHHLGANIDLIAVLDILGETAFNLQGKQSDDLLDIELLEEIAWYISERFGEALQVQLAAAEQAFKSQVSNAKRKPQIISLTKVRIQRSNQQY